MDYEKKYYEALERARELHGTVFVAAQDLTEQIFPELAESEDERIRRFLITIVNNLCAPNFKDVEKKDVLAYLEKQKELPFVKDVVPGLPGLYFYDGERMHFQGNPATEENPYDFAMSQQEKQKEHQNNSDAPKKTLGRALTSPLDKDMNLDEIAQDYVDAVKEYNPEPTWDLMQTAVCYGYNYREWKEQPTDAKSERVIKAARSVLNNWLDGTDCPDVSGDFTELEYAIREYDGEEKAKEQKPNIEICPHSIKSKSYKEQKPVEGKEYSSPECGTTAGVWSEEDSDNLERVDSYLWMLDDYVGDDCATPQGKTDKIRGNIQEVLSPWLKSLPERFNPQPQQEWNEEDEKMSISILNLLCSQIAYLTSNGKTTGKLFPTYANERDWFKKRLKSLRPQPKRDCKDCAMFLNGECTKPHWKPSEEQKEADFRRDMAELCKVLNARKEESK